MEYDLHNDLPVAPEQVLVTPEMLSPWQKEQVLLHNITQAKVPKLIPSLNNKTRYVCHSRNLEYYLRLGLKVSKVHRVLQFQQKEWLKDYIELNTEFRKKAQNDFEKDFFNS